MRRLGMTKIFLHPLAGVLSAYGMGLADITAIRTATVETPLDETALQTTTQIISDLAQAANDEVAAQGVAAQNITLIKNHNSS